MYVYIYMCVCVSYIYIYIYIYHISYIISRISRSVPFMNCIVNSVYAPSKILLKKHQRNLHFGGFFSKGRPTWQLVLCEPMIFTDVKVMGKGVVSSPNVDVGGFPLFFLEKKHGKNREKLDDPQSSVLSVSCLGVNHGRNG